MLLQIDTHTYLKLIYIDALPYDFKIHFDAFWQIDMMYVYIYILMLCHIISEFILMLWQIDIYRYIAAFDACIDFDAGH